MKRLMPLAMLVVVGYVSMGRHGVAAAPDQPTFTRDVAPILHARCVSCHRAGEVAPMALLTYEDARPWARSIKNKVVSRQMPPWMAEPGGRSVEGIGFRSDPNMNNVRILKQTKGVAGAINVPQQQPAPPPVP